MKAKKSESRLNELPYSPEILRSKIDANLQKHQSAIENVRNALIAVKKAKGQKPFELKCIDYLKPSRYFRFSRFKSK